MIAKTLIHVAQPARGMMFFVGGVLLSERWFWKSVDWMRRKGIDEVDSLSSFSFIQFGEAISRRMNQRKNQILPFD